MCQVEEKNGDRGKLARASGTLSLSTCVVNAFEWARWRIFSDEKTALGYEYLISMLLLNLHSSSQPFSLDAYDIIITSRL